MKQLRSIELRKMWIDFFKSKNHYYISSASLVPLEDESLLWINSGVATLKKYFEGKEVPPSKMLVNSQKCLRTNDIENIGKTSRHHTFFEMLGNFSIGDYFIDGALEYAYEFLFSKEWLDIDIDKIYITVFQEDKETYEKWLSLGIDPTHIFRLSKKTNFWDVGLGPCGPNTEIFYDRGFEYDLRDAKTLIANDIENDRFIEIWNIVFSKFNNDGKNNYTELPQKNIDTGAGFERLVSISQNKPSNFETDLFWPIIEELQNFTEFNYDQNYFNINDLSSKQRSINFLFKSTADFIRAIVMMISDGAKPTNNGRGYVIRRLIRKVIINFEELKMNDHVSINNFAYIVEKILGETYPDIIENFDLVQKIIAQEEKLFKETLSKSIKIFENEYKNNLISSSEIDSAFLFKLFETYGLPLELIEIKLNQLNLKFSKERYDELMKEFKNLSKQNAKASKALDNQQNLFLEGSKTTFVGYDKLKTTSTLIGKQKDADYIYLVFEETPFYLQSGGQVSDKGTIGDVDVLDLKSNINGTIIHQIENKYEYDNLFKIGKTYLLAVNSRSRKLSSINHSATHLLFAALEKIVGYDLPQQGSKVSPEELRFDFLSFDKITPKQIEEAQNLVNSWIIQSIESDIYLASQSEAKNNGAKFLDNVKYSETVRVVKFGNICIDLCGGTHVKNTKEIEQLEIVNFETKGSGIYRITAITTKDSITKYKILKTEKNIKDNLHQINEVQEQILNTLFELKKVGIDALDQAIKKRDRNDVEILRGDSLDKLSLNQDSLDLTKKLKAFLVNFDISIQKYIGNYLEENKNAYLFLDKLDKKVFGLFSRNALARKITRFLFNEDEDYYVVTIILNDSDLINVDINNLKNNYDIKGGGSKNYYQFKGLKNQILEFAEKIWNEL